MTDHVAGAERAPERIWLEFAYDEEIIGTTQFDVEPFSKGTKYIRADLCADLSRAPALAEECERLRASLKQITKQRNEAYNHLGWKQDK